jgi:hypothetical protein
VHALVCFLSTVVEFKGISFWVAFRVAALPGDLGWPRVVFFWVAWNGYLTFHH